MGNCAARYRMNNFSSTDQRSKLSLQEASKIEPRPSYHGFALKRLPLDHDAMHVVILGMDKILKDQSDEVHAVNFAGGNVHLITTKEGWDGKISEANKDGKFVVVNFSASWCGPCRVVAPLYSELSEKYPAFMFLTVDVDELTEFSSSWDIRATPTFFILKNGQEVDKLVGANKPELLQKIINLAELVVQDPKMIAVGVPTS